MCCGKILWGVCGRRWDTRTRPSCGSPVTLGSVTAVLAGCAQSLMAGSTPGWRWAQKCLFRFLLWQQSPGQGWGSFSPCQLLEQVGWLCRTPPWPHKDGVLMFWCVLCSLLRVLRQELGVGKDLLYLNRHFLTAAALPWPELRQRHRLGFFSGGETQMLTEEELVWFENCWSLSFEQNHQSEGEVWPCTGLLYGGGSR